MTSRIPTKGKWAQPNKGEIFGNIYRSQNIDLKTNPGKMRVSPRLVVNTKDNDNGISNMGVPCAFLVHSPSSTPFYYAACGIGDDTGSGKILVSASNSLSSAFANDALANTPTTISATRSDMVEWAGGNYGSRTDPSLLVSTVSPSAQIYSLRGAWDGSWFSSTVGGSMSTVTLINMCPAFNGNLYLTNGYGITYVPPSASAGTNPVAVNSGVGTIDFNYRYFPIWIRSTSTQLWIGLMTNVTNNGTRGYVAAWDTTGTAPQAIYDIQAPCALSCTILDDVPHIIDAYGRLKKFTGTGFTEVARLPVANQNIEMPGIYNPSTNSRWIHHRGMDIVDGKINISVNNFVSSGVYVEDMPSGIWEYDPSIGLYHKSSPCATTGDWGQQSLLTAGALFGSKRSTGTYLAGFAYYTDSGSTSRNGIFHDDLTTTTNRRGILTIPWIDSSQVADTFQKTIYRFRNLVSGSKIIGKFRTDKSATLPFVAAITWTHDNSFISTDSNWQYASVGDEVEVVQGVGASTTGHITQINSSGGTYTVIVDDSSMNIPSGSALVKVNNYRKMGEITQLNSSSQILAIIRNDNSVQIKTELRDEGGMELNDLTITSKTQQEAN